MDKNLRLQEKLMLLDELPLFANLSRQEKRLVADSSSIVECKKEEIVYKEGDLPNAFYCVIAGRLKAYIRRESGGGHEDLENLTRGKYFGIISLLTGEPHSVSVEAVNDSIILKIEKDDFKRILKRVPELAIHFSETLSRRLKRRDLHEKRIFESTIISVFGTSKEIGVRDYALSLAVSLKDQTNRRIILVRIDENGNVLSSHFFMPEFVKKNIATEENGIDVLRTGYTGAQTVYAISLITYLTNDYHYIIVEAPHSSEGGVFDILKQSDIIHILTSRNIADLELARQLISELGKPSSHMAHRIKVITCGIGADKALDYSKAEEVLNSQVYATLPAVMEESDYSKTIRRISRELGDCLVGLALGSGAALSIAQVGILKVLEKENIPVDIVVGTSMGALIGALWASGKGASEIEDILLRLKTKMDTFRLFDLTLPKMGLVKGEEIRKLLRSHLGEKTFHDLRLPFKAVACDIEKREEVVIDKGSLVEAIMASISIPGIFLPVRMGGRLLVDGGIINPLPTNVLTRLGVAKIIAVNTLPSPEDVQRSSRKVASIFDVIVNSFQASEFLLAEASCQTADIVIRPVLSSVGWYEFYEGVRLIRRGEEEALKHIQKIKELTFAGCPYDYKKRP